MSEATQHAAGRIYCLLLMQTEGTGQGGATPCRVGMVVVAEESPQLACWQALVRYPGCRVLANVDISDVVRQQAAMAVQMTGVEVDGHSLSDLRLQRANRARLVA